VADNDGRGDTAAFGPAASQQVNAGRAVEGAPTGPEHPTAPTPRPAGDRDRRWSLRADVATVVGTLVALIGLAVALLAWLNPTSPANPTAAAPAVVDSTGSSTASSATPGGSGSTPPGTSTADVRYLAEMSPATGGPNLQTGGRIGRHAMLIRCGTGESDDPSREVAWDLVGDYARFAATVTVSGQADPKSRVEVQVLADDVQADKKVLTLGGSASLNLPLSGVHRITLRITCEFPSMKVTFVDATLAS
jgi:hypothetical protein